MNWFVKLYAWACERLYEEFAITYDVVSWLVSIGQWSAWRRVALRYLPDTADSGPLRVLEIGFGTGELLLELAKRRISAVGLERSAPMHKIAAAKLSQRGLSLPRVRALAQAIPLSDQTFDAILSTFPAPYILDAQTLQECVRLLRKPEPATNLPGGRLIIVGLWVRGDNSLWHKVMPFFYGQPDPAWLHQIEQRVSAAGFVVTRSEQKVGAIKIGVIVAERR